MVTDIYDKEKRSDIMHNVKSKGNKSTEIALITVFNELNIKGWRRGYPVKGHPDFVFLKDRIVIFVDGCFWHGHNCRNTTPKGNEEFWQKKISGNVKRDQLTSEMFKNRGYKVIRIWECELKKKNRSILLVKLNELIS